ITSPQTKRVTAPAPPCGSVRAGFGAQASGAAPLGPASTPSAVIAETLRNFLRASRFIRALCEMAAWSLAQPLRQLRVAMQGSQLRDGSPVSVAISRRNAP